MAEISVGQIELSSYNPETGVKNTANVYHVEGIRGELTIAGLAMAICLQRATALEKEIVDIMSQMQATTKRIEQISKLEEELVNFQDTGIVKGKKKSESYDASQWGAITTGELPDGQTLDKRWTLWLKEVGVWDKEKYNQKEIKADVLNEILNDVETGLDSLNTNSQEMMITLQSTTIKRDQSYDMLTALVKSFMGMNVQIGANFR